jgi:hypothetical protein
MHHSLVLLGVNNLSLVDGSERKNVQSSLRHGDEILLLAQDEASHLTLPQLEALVTEQSRLPLVLRDVHDSHVVSVNVNSFVTDNEFFVLLLLVSVSEHKDVGITQIKLVFPLGQEGVLLWVLLIHSDDEETKLLFELVGKNVEHSVLMIVDDLLHASNTVKLIKINFLIHWFVEVNTILGGGGDHYSLGIVHLEELWLTKQGVGELVDCVDLLRVKVQSNDSIRLHENERIQLSC